MERWLVLLLLLVEACWSAACPQDCSCFHEQGLYKAVCSSLPNTGGKVEALQVLPEDESSVIPPLELIDGQFNMARHLKYLNLSQNSVFFVHKKAFYGARSLVEIDLSFNFIEELEPSVFQHLTKLTTLSLRGNPLQIVPEVPFLISNSIQNLDIGYCKLKSIPRGIFYGLKRLRYLSLDGNFLKTLKYNSLPKALTYVNLAQNHIVNVPTEVFTSLTNLRRIALSGNPINCTCALLNFQDWFSGKGRIFEDNVTCALPLEYSGINWGKIDENKLCLVEARRDELSRSTVYDKLFKNKLNKGYYFENEKSTSDENLQSDQPQSFQPDSQVEVMFANEETLAMGEMMRDEESKNGSDTNPEDGVDHEEIKQTSVTELPENKETEEIDTEKALIVEESNVTPANIPKELEQTLNAAESETQESSNAIVESNNLAPVEEDLANKTHESLTASSNNTESDIETNLSSGNINSPSESTQEPSTDLKNEPQIEDSENRLTDLNANKSVEFKHFEDPAAETDDFKKEGLLISSNEQTPVANVSLEEDSTILPDIEETTAEEELSTEEPIVVLDIEKHEDHNDNITQTSTTISDIPEVENNITTEATVIEPVSPDTTSEVVITEVYKNVSAGAILEIGSPNETLAVKPSINTSSRQDPSGSKAENEVAGAEVVMFCIAVLVICLVLYAIYKCRAPRARSHQNKNTKGTETNRSTEMQDMASLLPKSQGNDEQKNSKYTDKATIASETMKLIPEQTETENPEFTAVADTNAKTDENNSINNNSSNPVNKTPSLKPKNTLNVNQPEPIQRAKVRVGIIPDSIPKTPIFLQKTYNNGTKKV